MSAEAGGNEGGGLSVDDNDDELADLFSFGMALASPTNYGWAGKRKLALLLLLLLLKAVITWPILPCHPFRPRQLLLVVVLLRVMPISTISVITGMIPSLKYWSSNRKQRRWILPQS